MTAEILLVDDNAIQGTVRQTILSRQGRSVAVAQSAIQALEFLKDEELLRSIELVITDHWMPGMNGPEFITHLRQDFPKIPVLVLSGLPDAESEYEGLDVVFRVKPLAPDQLILLVESLLNEPMSRTA
jgi:CheY-like chemotaxis protein